MVALIFAIPILLFFLFIRKREPNQKEMSFWLLFLIPFGLMSVGWLQGEDIWKFWWAYLVLWAMAAWVLFEKNPKRKQEKASWDQVGEDLADNLNRNVLKEKNDPSYKGSVQP